MKTGRGLNIAKFIDHTLLRPDATESDIVRLCHEAAEYGFYSVCVHPSYIYAAKRELAGTDIKISTVIGFPLGMTLMPVKIYEAAEAVSMGADELDVVMNLGFAKSGKWDEVKREMSGLVKATSRALHKIIIETCYLTDREKKMASLMVMEAGAAFIKTSTGFGPSGALIRDFELIRSETKGRISIKASGGIRTLRDARSFIHAGAGRIGTSSGVGIMKEWMGESATGSIRQD